MTTIDWAAIGIGVALVIAYLVARLGTKPHPIPMQPLPKIPSIQAEKRIKQEEDKIDSETEAKLQVFEKDVIKSNDDAKKSGLGDVARLLNETNDSLRRRTGHDGTRK